MGLTPADVGAATTCDAGLSGPSNGIRDPAGVAIAWDASVPLYRGRSDIGQIRPDDGLWPPLASREAAGRSPGFWPGGNGAIQRCCHRRLRLLGRRDDLTTGAIGMKAIGDRGITGIGREPIEVIGATSSVFEGSAGGAPFSTGSTWSRRAASRRRTPVEGKRFAVVTTATDTRSIRRPAPSSGSRGIARAAYRVPEP